MSRTILARASRALLVACCVAVVLVVAVGGGSLVAGSGELVVFLPFVAVALAAVGLGMALPRIDQVVERLTGHREVSPYSALAQAGARVRADSLDQALPGLARVLAAGTGAARAVVWLTVGDRLVNAAEYPPPGSGARGRAPDAVANLAVLLARADTDLVVPVLDGAVLRAALAIGKPGAPITRADQLLVQDLANDAGLLLRGVAQNAELAERVRRADDLATELQGSRQRLARAREVERKRLVTELAQVTTDRLAALRAVVVAARSDLDDRRADTGAVQEELARARVELDDLLDRFRVLVRGVYPAVLRDQGPAGALDELAADLPRAVRVTGGLGERLGWEIESGIYYVAAAAVNELAGRPAEQELSVHVERSGGRVVVHIHDPSPTVTVEHARAALAEDVERLAALGGDLELTGSGSAATVTLLAWLPDRLEPLVESGAGAPGVW